MSRLRIIIDTNVLVSAAIQPAGLPAQVLELVAYRAFELCVSPEVLAEYREVFSRPKFAGLEPQRVSRLLTLIAAEATVVTPTERLSVSRHESDTAFMNVLPPLMPTISSLATPSTSTSPTRSRRL